MLVVAFLSWWYGPGWRETAGQLMNRLRKTFLNFSVPILLRTMFSPWRRIITPPSGSLQQKFSAFVDNAVSRAVGFMVRLLALIAAMILVTIYAVVGGVLLLLWPLLPLLGPALIVVGLL